MRFLIVFMPLVLLLAWLPGYWVRHTLKKYSHPANRYSGTGAELARDLLDRHGLTGITVARTRDTDSYDPATHTLWLSQPNHDGHSLTAVTIAAHEVGHAIQHAQDYAPLALRSQLASCAHCGQRIGAWLFVGIPIITLLSGHPAPGVLFLLGGLLAMSTAALVHCVTLPTELDASFQRAMPLLRQGNYLHPPDYDHAERLLKAAAFARLARSLSSLLDVTSWYRFLRR
ncbi:MAG: zinc metallopeptidase [Pseudomonadota bacterium]